MDPASPAGGTRDRPRRGFPPDPRAGCEILLVSPHPDDIAWSLGGTAARLRAGGATLRCLTLFGRTRYAPGCAEHGSIGATALRAVEEDAWAARAGVAIDRRALPDASLRGFDDETEIGPEPEPEIVRAIEAELRRALAARTPDLVLAPLALGAHVDHSATRRALANIGLAAGALCWYEDLPYAAGARPPSDADPVVVDVSAHWQDKEEGVRCFASQLPDEVLPVLRRHARAVSGERLWVHDPRAARRLRRLVGMDATPDSAQ